MSERGVAVGFRARTGSAEAVIVGGSASTPEIVDRRTIDLAPGIERFVYHAARELEPERAAAFVRDAERAARGAARRALRGLAKAHDVVAVGVALGKGPRRALPKLESILVSHALVHAAEGELYCDAIVGAAEGQKLPVLGMTDTELGKQGKQQRRLAEMGRALGPPWRREQRDAALVAWIALTRAA